MNLQTSLKSNSSSQSNSNSNPFPKLVPTGSINIKQKSKKNENENEDLYPPTTQNIKGNNFLSKIKTFDKNISKEKEIIILKRNQEREKQIEEKRRKKEEEDKKKKEESEKKEKDEQEKIKKLNEENKRKEEEEKRNKEEEKRRKKEEGEKKEKEDRERFEKIKEEKRREEEEKQRINEERRRRLEEEEKKEKERAKERVKKMNEEKIREEEEMERINEERRKRLEEEEERDKERIRQVNEERRREEEEKQRINAARRRLEEEKKNNELRNSIENYHKNKKLDILINQNINNIFGEKSENLSEYEKIHLFDRKINNSGVKEKMNLNVTLKNLNKDYNYEIEIYDDKDKLISKTEQKNEEKNINLSDNVEIIYEFTKVNSITIVLIKHINSIDKIKTTKRILLKKLISNINNNYEDKIENFTDNELININLDSPKDNNEEKNIELNFNTDNNENIDSKICYSIQKDDKILFKSPFCNSSNIKQSDKIKLCDLEPEFEISFYNEEFEEKRIKIKVDELNKGVIENINLPNINNLKINIFSEEIKSNNMIKLLKKGLNLNLSIAIDFTGSNGHPSDDFSLHKIKDGFINNYEKAIRENVEIISIYNKQDKYNVYGFGAKVNGEFKEIFNINGNDDPSIKGIDNIISEYKKTVTNVLFYGGTYFSPIIREVKNKLETIKNNDFNYYILLIISDGIIDDINETIDSIIEASKFPISFIIIGIGNDVSNDMKRLNGENGKLISSKGEILKKDIVQYVHFNDYADNLNKLTEAVLKYIPDQIYKYYKDQI